MSHRSTAQWKLIHLGLAAGLSAVAVGASLFPASPSSAATTEDGLRKLQAGDTAGALKDLNTAADKGDREAAFTLGQIYRLGRGVTADPKRAIGYYERAARAGHVLAQSNLAGLLYFSNPPLRNRPQAIVWWSEAVKANDPRSQYMLGILHFNGDELPRDWPRAFGYTLLAQQAGLPEADEAYKEMLKFVTPADQERGRAMVASLSAPRGPADRQVAMTTPVRAPAPPPPAAPAPAPAPAPAAAAVASSAPEPAPEPMVSAPLPPPMPAARPTTPAPAPVPVPASELAPPPPAAPAPVPAAVAGTAPATGAVWRVQVGSFSTQDRAVRHWETLSQSVSALAPLSPTYVADAAVTKVQVGAFPSRTGADALCGQLRAGGQTCFVVAPKP